jgi:hypothetical protein
MSEIVSLGLFTSRSLASQEEGRRLLRLLESAGEGLGIRRYGPSEPLEHHFDPADPDATLQSWGTNWFFWKARRKGVLGSYSEGVSKGRRDAIHLIIEEDGFDPGSLLEFMGNAADALRADFAYLHKTFPEELTDREYYRVHVMPFTQGLSALALQKGLPGIPWTMYIGAGFPGGCAPTLSQVPAFSTQVVGDGLVIQSTGHLYDYERDYQPYRTASDKIGSFLKAQIPQIIGS